MQEKARGDNARQGSETEGKRRQDSLTVCKNEIDGKKKLADGSEGNGRKEKGRECKERKGKTRK